MADISPPTVPAPWHAGEIHLQKAIGVDGRMAEMGPRVIRDYMPDQHRQFYAQLPFLVLGSVDHADNVWATLVSGSPGFAVSPDPKRLVIDHALSPDDPASQGLEDGCAAGLLGIELHTRRRNRMNGRIVSREAGRFAIAVEHSFGNCPQYICKRDFAFVPVHAPGPVTVSQALTDTARAMIEKADTFFVASYTDDTRSGRQVDASHRGGKAGFVLIGDNDLLTIPDFAGNLHFNTLGNFLLNPRAGLIFVDFTTGDVLQMTGSVQVILDSPEIAAFQGAERLWTFAPQQVVLRTAALPLRWVSQKDGISPNSLMTGDWTEARSRLKAAQFAGEWRRFRVAKITDESQAIRSFVLEPEDDAGLIPHLAGQHLPIRLQPDGADRPIIRTYTLSTAPSDGRYRISVKRQGLVSGYLHDHIRIGDTIDARAPAGTFTIDPHERRAAVLLGAGIGITPILSMLRHIVYEGLRTRRVRRTWLFQSSRNWDDRAFDTEIRDLVDVSKGQVTWVRVVSEEGADSSTFDAVGRIDVDLLKAILPFDDYDFYMCGPSAFMQSLYDGLRQLNVADARIHAEAFGPSSLSRQSEGAQNGAANNPKPSTGPVPVAFVRSAKEARWTPQNGSLLELAESRGIAPEFGCRAGTCGICKVKVLAGAVAYTNPPAFPHAHDDALLCCAMPADGPADRLILDL